MHGHWSGRNDTNDADEEEYLVVRLIYGSLAAAASEGQQVGWMIEATSSRKEVTFG